MTALGREQMSDAEWFERYGTSVGAAAASVANPELVAEFSALVAPLERRVGKPLGEPGRRKCFEALYVAPDGFRRLVADAERRGSRNPLGLLVRMVEAGEHRLAVQEAEPAA